MRFESSCLADSFRITGTLFLSYSLISIPAPVEIEAVAVEVIESEAVVKAVEAIEPEITIDVVAVEVTEPPLTPAQKRAAKKAAKAEAELVAC